MKPTFRVFAIVIACIATGFYQCSNQTTTGPEEKKEMSQDDMVARGKYIVFSSGCRDCHSPKTFTQQGPVPDESKLLMGHPAGSPLPPIDTNALRPGYWYLAGPDLTTWVGPWGISYSANITPDSTTGIGAWTEENFMQAIRTGKHLGMEGGRPILPPMPWPEIASLTDEDLRSVYAYLRTIPAITNQVPAPVAPPDVMAMAMAKQ